MRVPRALEFPAVILTTALLTFTGVSALQASVNEPLAKLAQQRTGEKPSRVDALDEASEEIFGADLRAALSPGQPTPPALLSAPTDIVQPEALAVTGAAEVGAAVPAGAASLPEAASVEQPALPAPAPAQAAGAAAGAVASRPAPAQPPRPAPPVQAAPPSPQPTPVSGMDFVWDQMFGSGSFAKPGNPAAPTKGNSKGNGNPGVGQACPPGQAKKGTC